MSTKILAIETSCDDTALSIISASPKGTICLSQVVSSQTELHAEWGGVVPNLAAREHQKNIFPLLKHVMDKASITPENIDLIAVTQGPGLIPALLVGTSVAKTLAYLWNKPLIGIHHVEGHIYANFVGKILNDEFRISKRDDAQNSTVSNLNSQLSFPILCLVVSGGHTQLVLMRDHFTYEIIGQTLDDAAGEAFDKVARILGIGYPGGPAVAQYAQKFQETKNKNQTNFNNQKSIIKINSKYEINFPRPMLSKNNFDFSFSGLKTAVLYETKKLQEKLSVADYQLLIPQICYEFQQAVVDVLVKKTIKAAQKYEAKTILLAGGVSANTELRKQMAEAIERSLGDPSNQSPLSYSIPDLSLTGDNATMIATAATFRWQNMGEAQKETAKNNWKTLVPNANLKLA